MNKKIETIIREALEKADEFKIAGYVATVIATNPHRDNKDANIDIIINWLRGNELYKPTRNEKFFFCSTFSISGVRVCDACGEFFTEGFSIDNDNLYACSEACAIKVYENEGYDELAFRQDLKACESNMQSGEVMNYNRITL